LARQVRAPRERLLSAVCAVVGGVLALGALVVGRRAKYVEVLIEVYVYLAAVVIGDLDLVVSLFVASLCGSYFLTYSVEPWSSSSLLDNVQGVMLDLGFGAFALVGALLVARRPANSIG
jgi:hypothetical protein